MKPKIARPQHSSKGIALIATILILAMCFASLLTVLSLTSLSLKRGGKTQYHSYQALLAAESGVNSFVARATTQLFDTTYADVSLDTLNNWLESNSFNQLNLLDADTLSIQNSLRFSNLTPQSATLESIGTVQRTTETGESLTVSKKVLRVDFKLHAAGSRLRIQSNAALTTLGDLRLEGNAHLAGAKAQDLTGLIREYDQARANPTPLPNSKHLQLRIQHPNRFHAGQYIELNSGRYKVTTVDKNSGALELLPLDPTGHELIDDFEIALIPVALASDLVASQHQTIKLPIASTASAKLALNQNISVADYEAVIEDINENDTTIRWINTIPKQTLKEGSTISLGRLGARSASTIDSTATTSLEGGSEDYARLATTSLFEQSFGLSKDELLGPLNAYDQRSGKGFALHTANELQSISNLNGLYYTEDTVVFNSLNPLCGSALIIAAADIAVDSVCDEGFSGLLYVFGSFRHTGGTIDGAMVSEEARANPLPSTTSHTHLSGQASIRYNATALNNWQGYLQDEFANQDGKQIFQQVAGSWRLE